VIYDYGSVSGYTVLYMTTMMADVFFLALFLLPDGTKAHLFVHNSRIGIFRKAGLDRRCGGLGVEGVQDPPSSIREGRYRIAAAVEGRSGARSSHGNNLFSWAFGKFVAHWAPLEGELGPRNAFLFDATRHVRVFGSCGVAWCGCWESQSWGGIEGACMHCDAFLDGLLI
jgi:hypothetical protein